MGVSEALVAQTAAVFAQTVEDLCGRSRARPLVAARQAAMWALRQRYPSLSLEQIGAALGGRHSTTVRHGLRAAEARARHDAAYQQRLQQVLARVARRGHAAASLPAASTVVGGPAVELDAAVCEQHER